ncbi:hypothetical protein [Pendulispora albinea]|uniref:Uncharacterized protein n=1 Tax=Pendulispora albinea TaxID=2741071 RepID=A0ABZ2M9Z1_9BACT
MRGPLLLFLFASVGGCVASRAVPVRTPYTTLPEDAPCGEPAAQSEVRNLRAFRRYVEIRSITPLEHHFSAAWGTTFTNGSTSFATRRNPTTGEIDVRREGQFAIEGQVARPSFKPVPRELAPFVDEIRRRATREDIPTHPKWLEFAYAGEYRVLDVAETMPLYPPSREPRVAVFDSAVFKADASLTRFERDGAGVRLGKGVHALCFGSVCACDRGRWIDGLASSTPRGTTLLSELDAESRDRIFEAARDFAAGRKSVFLSQLLTKDKDVSLLPANLEQQLALDITVAGRAAQSNGQEPSTQHLELHLDARSTATSISRDAKSALLDGVEVKVSASLAAEGASPNGRTQRRLLLTVRIDDGRGRVNEQTYHARGNAIVDGSNVAFIEFEIPFDEREKDENRMRHVMPGGPNTSSIEVFVGYLRPIW